MTYEKDDLVMVICCTYVTPFVFISVLDVAYTFLLFCPSASVLASQKSHVTEHW